MAVTSRNLHPSPTHHNTRKIATSQRSEVDFGIIHMFWKPVALVVLIYAAFLVASGQVTVWLNDLKYGRPRTMQLAGMVGHNEANGQPTHFVALNLNRRVVVMELPGGDATKAQVLQGPYLFGADEHLTPVQLELLDVNQDAKSDLVISVKNEEIIYINAGDAFRLINDEERHQLEAAR